MNSTAVGVLTEPAWLGVAELWVAVAAALVAAVSAVVIAWQAVQTRRSTRAALDAVDIARREYERGEALRMDALKGRIDAEMPRLTVTAELRRGQARDPEVPEDVFIIADEPFDTLTMSEYVLPRDEDRRLRVLGTVTVSNDGPRRAEVRVRRWLRGQPTDEVEQIEVGEAKRFRVRRDETIRRWVDASTGERPSSEAECEVFRMSYGFPGWVGAVDEFIVSMDGFPLDPVPGNAAAWTPVDIEQPRGHWRERRFSINVQPFTRTYFQNRRDDSNARFLPD